MNKDNITNIDDNRPHIDIEAADGSIHVIPVSFLEDVRAGKISLTEMDDFELLAPVIVNIFLVYLGH